MKEQDKIRLELLRDILAEELEHCFNLDYNGNEDWTLEQRVIDFQRGVLNITRLPVEDIIEEYDRERFPQLKNELNPYYKRVYVGLNNQIQEFCAKSKLALVYNEPTWDSRPTISFDVSEVFDAYVVAEVLENQLVTHYIGEGAVEATGFNGNKKEVTVYFDEYVLAEEDDLEFIMNEVLEVIEGCAKEYNK